MTHKNDLANLVEKLSVTRKKIAFKKEEIAKLEQLESEEKQLYQQLAKAVEPTGLEVPEAIELLLAAR